MLNPACLLFKTHPSSNKPLYILNLGNNMRVPNFLKGSDNLEQYPVVIDFVQRTWLVNIFSQMANRNFTKDRHINDDQPSDY